MDQWQHDAAVSDLDAILAEDSKHGILRGQVAAYLDRDYAAPPEGEREGTRPDFKCLKAPTATVFHCYCHWPFRCWFVGRSVDRECHKL